MGILRNIGRLTGGPVQVIDRNCWLDADLDRFFFGLPALNPSERVEATLAYLRPLRLRPDHHLQASDLATEYLGPALQLIEQRCSDPRTHPDDRVDLLVLLASLLIDQAWEVRGSGTASSVPREAWPVFRRLVQDADDILVAVLEMVPAHPGAAATRLISGLAQSIPQDEWWQRFEVARTARPTLYRAHTGMLNALCAKWYGSDEAMFGFGRQVAEHAPPGDPVVAMLPYAHAEYICGVQMGRSDPQGPSPEEARLADEDAVMAASWKWAGDGSRPAPTHPHALHAHNLFAWYLGNSRRHRDRGRWHLEQTQHRIHSMPWSYLADNHHEPFAELHTRLGVR